MRLSKNKLFLPLVNKLRVHEFITSSTHETHHFPMDLTIHFPCFCPKLPIIQVIPASNFAKDGNSDSTVSEMDFLGFRLKFIAVFSETVCLKPYWFMFVYQWCITSKPWQKTHHHIFPVKLSGWLGSSFFSKCPTSPKRQILGFLKVKTFFREFHEQNPSKPKGVRVKYDQRSAKSVSNFSL